MDAIRMPALEAVAELVREQKDAGHQQPDRGRAD